MSHEYNIWREGLMKEAFAKRYQDAQNDLAGERKALDWLRETGRDGAAKRMEANIVKMEARVERFRNDMGMTG